MLRRTARGWLQEVGASTVAASALGLAVLQYFMPSSGRFPGPVYEQGSRDFLRFLTGASAPALPLPVFVALFELLVIGMWAGYAAVLYAGIARGIREPWRMLAGGVVLALALVVVFPTSLTHDVFAYLGYARMGPIHGVDPYATSLARLAQMGDAAASRYPAPHPSVYGAGWTLLTSGAAAVLRGAPLLAQAIAFKAIQALACFGGSLAARGVPEPARARERDLAMVAFALNPLLLIEGPGNGHNDVLMVALIVFGLALLDRHRLGPGYLLVGLAVTIKIVAAAIVPLLLVEQFREWPRLPHPVRSLAAPLMALVPAAVGALAFRGADVSAVMGLFGSRATAEGGSTLFRVVTLVSFYAAALLWMIWDDGRRRASAKDAWVAWTAASLHVAFPGTLPWYLVWPTGVAAAWERRRWMLSGVVMLMALRWMLFYVALR